MSKKIKLQNGSEIMQVEVSSLGIGFDVNNYADKSELMYLIPIESTTSTTIDETLKIVDLPKGDWKIISKF